MTVRVEVTLSLEDMAEVEAERLGRLLRDLSETTGVDVVIHGPSPGLIAEELDHLESHLHAARLRFKGSVKEINELSQRIESARAVNRWLAGQAQQVQAG